MPKKIGGFEYSGPDQGDKRYLNFEFGLMDEKGRSVGAIAYIKNVADSGSPPEYSIWTNPARGGQAFGKAKTLAICASMQEAESAVAQSLQDLYKRAQEKFN
ncbi:MULTISPECIES: hypothetical protein [Thiorhodovibrio]|uniref:hypothetical protein n=1 Tax=Thiorhodovibrio TaxID=61593 RepID=UPI001911D4E4|nr:MULTISPECIES: hypothetical protein [Thiorhodovibrio]WPL11404.1 hypothetical protein Thiosp_01139 [Thiorhodovibrio litoralis]